VVASDDRTTPPIVASVTKNNTLIEVMAFRHVVAANNAYSSPIQNGGSFHPENTKANPISGIMTKPNVFLTNKMQLKSIPNPIPHVPIRAAKLLLLNISIIPPTMAVLWYPALATHPLSNKPEGIIVFANPEPSGYIFNQEILPPTDNADDVCSYTKVRSGALIQTHISYCH
jgi:hypothetical protein